MSSAMQRQLAVIGAGTMGSQIAAQSALHGVSVILIDNQRTHLEKAMARNRLHLERRVEKGTLTQGEVTAIIDRIQTSRDIESAAAAGFVIEAVFEEIEPKRAVFAELVEVCGPDAILATNSSSFPISRIAQDLPYSDRMCNVHFFHPVLVMKLVEVMRGPLTSDETVEAAVDLVMRIDRRPVVIEREVPGLIVNRILAEVKREALWLAAEGYATPDAIDLAVRLGLNHPMGPFELLDLSGLDIFYRIMAQRYEETGDESWRPPEMLKELVKAGDLGRKTGRGFYEYEETTEATAAGEGGGTSCSG